MARIIEFLSYLLPTSLEYIPETRVLLELLGRNSTDKRVSLWMLLKYLDASKQDAINAVKDELRRIENGQSNTLLLAPLDIDHWSFNKSN